MSHPGCGLRAAVRALALSICFFAAAPTHAEQFFAQTPSMAPAVYAGETVELDKAAYADREPVHGDIVVYALSWSPTVLYAHRVIGVGGDTVQLTNGTVMLNGRAVPTVDAGVHKSGNKSVVQIRETLPNGREYLVLHENPAAPENTTAVVTVPAGHFFVLGDNRNNASDSRRKDAGFLPRAAIIGRLTTITNSRTDGRDGMKLN